jgi:ribonuclease Z
MRRKNNGMTKKVASASSDRDQASFNPKDQTQKKPGTSQHRASMPSRREFLKVGAAAAVGSGLVAASRAGLASSSADAAPPKNVALPKDDATIPLKKVIARPDLWFYPGEPLDPNEMRVTLMGTGWGSMIRPDQKGASVFVELGNGDSFVFDVGPGCGINYNVMQIPFSRMTKIFLTHLHLDHTSDLAWIYTFGPSGDRFTPLQVWGPSGDKPEYGTKANIEGIKVLSQWHRPSFASCIDVGKAYELEIRELDYRLNPGIVYQANGVTIKHFPRLHIIDGAIGYRLEWNGLSMVWTGDGQPSYITVDNAKGVDLFISETAPSTERFAEATGLPLPVAKIIVAYSHTPAKALGKMCQLANPSLAVTCHCPVDPEELQDFINGVAAYWKGKYQIGQDLMVFNVSRDKILIRSGPMHTKPWTVTVIPPASNTPTLNVKDFQSEEIFGTVIKDY